MYIFVYLNMLLNRYVQYCKCKGSFERREGRRGRRVRQTATHISYMAAYGLHPVTVLLVPSPSLLPDLRANDPAGHGTLPARQWTSTYVCCRQCSVKFALFSNPLSSTVTHPLPPSLRYPLLIFVVAREHVFLLLCCL